MGSVKRSVVWALVAAALAASGAGAAPLPAITNGEFEDHVDLKDESCEVFGGTSVDLLPPPGPWLVSVTPCEASPFKAVGWSSPPSTQFGDWDGDGDREALIDGSIPPDPRLGNSHNMWQAYSNRQQAYTADFAALAFRIEQGAVPLSGSSVVISLSATPLREATPWVGVFIDCSLTFSFAKNTTGAISRDPLTATFRSAWSGCDATAAAYAAADSAGKRAILGQMRIVQVSFWNFQSAQPIRIDGVDLAGAETVAG